MPDRDWRLFAALGLGFVAIVGAGIAVTWLAVSAYRQEHTTQRDDAASAYQAQAYEQAELNCSDAPDSEREKCLRKETEAAQDEKRSEYDLRAQQEMSEWALGVLVLSTSGFVVSSAGLLALVWTFHEQRKLSRDQSRAFIDQRGATIRVNSRTGFLSVSFFLFNGGDTPALHFEGDVRISFRPRYGPNADDTEPFDRPLTITGGTILRNSCDAVGAVLIRMRPEEIDQILNPVEPVYEGKPSRGWTIDPRAKLEISGELVFEDAFGRDHKERVHYWTYSLPIDTEHIMLGSRRGFSPETAMQQS